MVTYREWSQIHSLRELFVTTNTTSTESTIYGNGLNQTEIIVHMVALDSRKNEIIGIPTSDLIAHAKLIDYITGEVVPIQDSANSNNNWNFSLHSNGFNFAPEVSYSATNNDSSSPILYAGESEESNASEDFENYSDTQSPVYPLIGAIVSLYVMRGPNASSYSKQFAVQVRLTKPSVPIPVYSTGFNGTPGFNSYVTVRALDPIDYSYEENRIVTKTPATIMSRSIRGQQYAEDRELGWVITDIAMQSSKRSTIVISPAIGGKFLSVEDLSNFKIDDSVVNQGQMLWDNSEVPGFIGIENEYPISVLGRSLNIYRPFFINYWYLNPEKARFYGHCLFDDGNTSRPTYYRLFTNFDENNIYETPNPGRLTLWQFELPINLIRNILWRSIERENLRLRLTDRYGNRGEISLVFDLNDNFDEPRIV